MFWKKSNWPGVTTVQGTRGKAHVAGKTLAIQKWAIYARHWMAYRREKSVSILVWVSPQYKPLQNNFLFWYNHSCDFSFLKHSTETFFWIYQWPALSKSFCSKQRHTYRQTYRLGITLTPRLDNQQLITLKSQVCKRYRNHINKFTTKFKCIELFHFYFFGRKFANRKNAIFWQQVCWSQKSLTPICKV